MAHGKRRTRLFGRRRILHQRESAPRLPLVETHQRRPKADGTPGARRLTHVDDKASHALQCLIGGDRANLRDVGCDIFHNASLEAGLKSVREVVVPAPATEEMIEARVDIDAWRHPGQP